MGEWREIAQRAAQLLKATVHLDAAGKVVAAYVPADEATAVIERAIKEAVTGTASTRCGARAMSDDAERSTALAQAVVYGVSQAWLVSTINRPSSAMLGPGRYAETIVWEWDAAKRERGRILWQGAASEFSIRTHLAAIERLTLTGSAEEPESDE